MKRKYYFLISSCIQIIASIMAIINSNKIISELLKQTSLYPDNLQDRINGLYGNSGHIVIIIMAGICIILNIFIILWSLNDNLLKKKGKVIACSVASLFLAFYPIVELFAIINIIVMSLTKRVNKEDYPDKKLDMPLVEREIVTKNKIILSVILLVVYFSQFLWSDLIPDKGYTHIIVGCIFYIVMIILSIMFFKDLLDNNFKIFRKNIKAYFQNLIGKVGIFYLVYFMIAMIVVFSSNMDTSVNQSNVEALPIWYSLPLAVFYAPLVEECLFRGCIRRFIKNDKVFIIVSALSFGLLHTVFTEPNLYNAVVLAIPYATIGGFLAYLYNKTNNICTNMAFHAFHNSIAMIITILIKGII